MSAAEVRQAANLRRGGGASADSDRRLLSFLAEFAEVLLHQLLRRHRVYPSGAFELRQRYGLPLWQCQHPRVAEYAAAVASTLEMCAAEVDRLRVTFWRPGGGSQRCHRRCYSLLLRLRPESFDDCADSCLRLEAQLARLLLTALGPLDEAADDDDSDDKEGRSGETRWSVEFVSRSPLEGLASPHFPIGRVGSGGVGGSGGGGGCCSVSRLEPLGSAVAPFLGLDLAVELLPDEDER